MVMVHLFRIFMIFSVAAFAGIGCSHSPENTVIQDKEEPAQEKVVLTFWDSNAGPRRTPYYEELIKRFEEKHPEIDVKYVGIPNQSNLQKYEAAIASNDTPDVAEVYPSWLSSFTARGALLPLDEHFEQWSEKDKINKDAIQFNREVVADDKLYGIPNTQNLDVFWYRQDWYKQEKVQPPDTWDEFFYAVKSMTDKANRRYGYSIRGGKGGSFQLQRLMYSYSGISDYFDEHGKSTINDPRHVEFVKQYFDIYKSYTPESDIRNSYKEMITAFDTGAVALIHHNIGSYGEHSQILDSEQFAAHPLPKTPEGKYVVEAGNTNGYSIFKNTKHPNEAWKLLSYLCSAEAQSYWNEKIGQIPTHMDAVKDPWVKQTQHIQKALQVLENPQTVYYYPPFYLPDYRSILDNRVDPGIQDVMSGKKTVEDFLNEWARAMEISKQKYEK